MPRPLPCALLSAFVLSAASLVAAQPFPGLETWVDTCEVDDPDLSALLDNEALMVDTNRIHENPDGTFRLDHNPFTHPDGGPEYPLCPDAQFSGQTQVTDGFFRSAVQVGRDLVLTAWHNEFTVDPGPYRLVFGIHDRLVGDLCLQADFDHIPASQVYEVAAVVADGYANGGTLDFLLLKLDRVVGDNYPRMRRSGRGKPGESATVIGHPEKMAAKADLAGVVGQVEHFVGREWQMFAGLHTMDSSSGAMVYNRSQRRVETVVHSGYGVDFEGPTFGLGCYYIVDRPGFRSHNASLRYFAQHIPAFELIVHNLDPVVLVAAAGQPVGSVTSRTVTAPLTAASSLDYQIVPPGLTGPGQPSLSISAPVPNLGTLAPGSSFTIQETAGTPGLPCGIYEPSYAVRDLTNGFEDVARHVFEIGAREFVVGEPPARGIDDIAAPFEETVAYTIDNPRPTPVTVRVSTTEPWVTLNGTSGPGSIDVLVAANSSQSVTVGVGNAMLANPYGNYIAALTFAVAPGSACPIMTGPVTRNFQFIWGTESFSGPAVAIPDGSPNGVQVDLTVPESFCIADVDVALRSGTLPGDQLFFKLVSPEVSRRVIWNHGTGDVAGPFDVVLDDEGETPPYQPLSVLNGENGGGTWHLTAVDDVPGVAGSLDSWVLSFRACPLP